MHIHIILKQDAKTAGMRRYFTGRLCRNGHLEERLISNSLCLGCAREANRKHYPKLAERRRNPSARRCINARSKIFREKHREKISEARRKKYYDNHKESIAQRRRYYANNLAKIVAANALIKLRRQLRAPAWLSDEQIAEIREFYLLSAEISKRTKVKYHVDHIVPLLGKNVSGLHVPWNLQVIPAMDNLRKSNKLSLF